MKVLIIGGTGLISTAITRQLVARGDEVTHMNRGRRAAEVPAGVRQITVDRTDHAAFEMHAATAGTFDCVIDMVCFTPEEAASDVRAFAGHCGQLIFCSTVDVYTKPYLHYPVRENHPRSGINDYGRNKTLAEEVFLAAHAASTLPVTILRPAYTYGESGVIIHTFGWSTSYLDRIRRGLPIIVHGDGTSLWAACHVDDAATAFVGAAGNFAVLGRTYTVASTGWMTWNDYHRRVAQALGAPEPQLVHIPSELLVRLAPERTWTAFDNFTFSNIFDVSAAQADLGFAESVSWEEGVRRTVAWLDARGRVQRAEDDPLEEHVIAAWERATATLAAELGAEAGS